MNMLRQLNQWGLGLKTVSPAGFTRSFVVTADTTQNNYDEIENNCDEKIKKIIELEISVAELNVKNFCLSLTSYAYFSYTNKVVEKHPIQRSSHRKNGIKFFSFMGRKPEVVTIDSFSIRRNELLSKKRKKDRTRLKQQGV